MTRNLRLILLLLALLSSLAFANEAISVKQLQDAAKKYDGKEITVIGMIEKFEQRTSRAGNEYFIFQLVDKADPKSTVNVFGRGKIEKAPKHGTSFEIKGIYRVAKKLGNKVYKNEIETKPSQVKVSKV